MFNLVLKNSFNIKNFQDTLLGELFYFIKNKYFTVSTNIDYTNFTVSTNLEGIITIILISICLSFIISSFIVMYIEKTCGNFVTKLLDNNCINIDNAKTLVELDYFFNHQIRKKLYNGTILKIVVNCIEEDNCIKEKKKWIPDFLHDHFYIPEDKKIRAELRFKEKKNKWWILLLIALITVIFTASICINLSGFLTLIDNLITMINI